LTLARKEVILVTGLQIIRDESVSRAPLKMRTYTERQ